MVARTRFVGMKLFLSVAAMITVIALPDHARAQSTGLYFPQTQFSEEHYFSELAGGAVVTVDDRFGYAQSTFAPRGGLDRPGLRINVLLGGGNYRLDNGTWVDKTLANALAGWAFWSGNRGAAVYAGITYEDHASPPSQAKSGEAFGAAVRGEGWWRLDASTLFSAGAAYSSPHEEVSGRVAVDRQIARYFRARAEASIGDDIDGTFWSAGAGGTAHIFRVEATVMLGVSGDDDDTAFSARVEFRVRR